MTTFRLIPSTYYLSNSTYLSVSNASNMYANTDSTNYGTVTNSQNGTTSYYIYLRGFNFDDIPSTAIINSWTVKIKAYESGISTSSSYSPKLCHGTSQITSTCSAITTSATVREFTSVSADWEDIVGYGDTFGIRINCRRSNKNTTGHMYIYGAEIEVDCTLPEPVTVTSTLTGDGTISPSGATQLFKGDEYELTITPTNKSDTVTATKDGVDITSELVGHSGSTTTVDTDLGSYSLISGGFNGSGASYFQGLVGAGIDHSKTTSNYYSSSSSTKAIFQYQMHFTLPSNAVVERVWCEVNGHAESTSNANEFMCVQLMSGSTELTEEINFKSIGKSNTTVTLECETLPTLSQLASMVMQCTLGYYGGAINGATCYVQYSIPSGNPDYYTYTFIANSDATIAVVIGGSSATLYLKINGVWTAVSKAYLKVNNSWVEQDITTLFDTNTNYVKDN